MVRDLGGNCGFTELSYKLNAIGYFRKEEELFDMSRTVFCFSDNYGNAFNNAVHFKPLQWPF